MSASSQRPRSRFQPGIAAMYACTGASPSAFAICGLPPERSFAGLASLAPDLALAPDFGGDLDFGALDHRFSATAAWIKALNASASSTSPSRMSMARRVFPSRLELKSPRGSSKEAPRAKVSLTTCLYASPVQTIPAWDHTGTPNGLLGLLHLHSSTMSGSASW